MRYAKDVIERLTGEKIAVSDMQLMALARWIQLYRIQPISMKKNEKKVNRASAIAGEFARLVTLEMKSKISGSLRAEYINEIYQKFLVKLRREVEYAAAFGGVVFKPYLSGNKIIIDCVNANEFYPLSFDTNDEINGAIFRSRITQGKKHYTKLEIHKYSNGKEHIRNLFFESNTETDIGRAVSKNKIDLWRDFVDEVTIVNLKRPLFCYFKMPFANSVDIDSPLGVSVYSKACDLIEDADAMYNSTQWEYESAERAIFLHQDALKRNPKTGETELPEGSKRLYRLLAGDNTDLYHDFAPEIRYDALHKGEDEILRKIEFECSLAYGTLSNTQNVDKTAEEIRTSKQRSYAAVSDIQSSLEDALTALIYAIDVWCDLKGDIPAGEYNASFEWNDSILADRNREFEEKRALVIDGIMKPWEFRAWYFGEDEETAKKMVAEQDEEFLEE